jgi:hypothetical protein
LRELFARFAVACVVLESEHPPNSLYDRVNPWQRYGGRGITLVKNPDWPEEHKNLIDLAELQVVPL